MTKHARTPTPEKFVRGHGSVRPAVYTGQNVRRRHRRQPTSLRLRVVYDCYTIHFINVHTIILLLSYGVSIQKKNDHFFRYLPSLPSFLVARCRSSRVFFYTFFTSPFISGRTPFLPLPPRLPGRFRVFAPRSRTACARPVPVADCPGAA